MFICNSLPTTLALQLAKHDLSLHYKVKVADRDYVIKTLKMILDNDEPKIVIRADIKFFFESIDLSVLIEKIKRDSYVSPITIKSLKLINGQLREVAQQKVNGKKYQIGIPRGLAISSHLSELYMSQFDNMIKFIPGVYYYQRYVDDIVIVAYPKSVGVDELTDLLHQAASTFALELHVDDGKWKVFDTSQEIPKIDFEYLGYRFKVKDGKIEVGLSQERENRYRKRIDAVFEHYNRIQHLRKKKESNIGDSRATASKSIVFKKSS